MDYTKITIKLNPDHQEFRDILMASMGELGFESFVEQDQTLEAYIPSSHFTATMLNSLNFVPLFNFEWQSEQVPEQNWNEVWEKNYFQPLLIAGQCLIRAPFHTDYPKAKYELIIEPNMAFGTGNHETTSLVLEQLLGMDLKGKKVLDMGCGTGVLAMLASKLGASEILAIDIDQWAYEGTLENCRINQCNNINVLIGDASLLDKQQFDIILANIHKNVLLHDLSQYSKVLVPGGMLIMSGFYENDLEDLHKAAGAQHLIAMHYLSRNKWVAASYQKNNRTASAI